MRWKLFQTGLAGFLALFMTLNTNAMSDPEGKTETVTLGGGCFWCTEAVFLRLKGVESVRSGYSGGHVKNPAYREVTTGSTGHAEVVQITFDPAVIAFREILEVFFAVHDPTTLNRQGADVGTQYRSAIFYHTPEQKVVAGRTILDLENERAFDRKIVTEVTPFSAFYPAEEYHDNYYARNSSQPSCSVVISPKIKKLEKYFKDKLQNQQQ